MHLLCVDRFISISSFSSFSFLSSAISLLFFWSNNFSFKFFVFILSTHISNFSFCCFIFTFYQKKGRLLLICIYKKKFAFIFSCYLSVFLQKKKRVSTVLQFQFLRQWKWILSVYSIFCILKRWLGEKKIEEKVRKNKPVLLFFYLAVIIAVFFWVFV